MRVVALYRYPVKGFAPEYCETLTLVEGGRVAGDRVLALRFANSPSAGDSWATKHEHVALVNTPGLACLGLTFEHHRQRLRIAAGGDVLIEETLDEGGRKRIAAAVQDYVLKLPENPLSGYRDRLPLRLVGDGVAPRFQDDRTGLVTLHSRESLAALAATAMVRDLSEMRFRSNIAIDGAHAWQEQGWVGRTIRIGEMVFEVVKPKTRCLATHANPVSGERDVEVMKILPNAFQAERPTFAIGMTPAGCGTIRIGDKVTLLTGNSHRHSS